MPGIPSIYYASEWAYAGMRNENSDAELRPKWDHSKIVQGSPESDLFQAIRRLIRVRKENPVLFSGTYEELFKDHKSLIFKRENSGQKYLVAVNSSGEEGRYSIEASEFSGKAAFDVLNDEEIDLDKALVLYPHWLRILRIE